MWRLKDKKIICLMSTTFIFLLCLGSAQGNPPVPGACDSKTLREIADGAAIASHYRPSVAPVIGAIDTMVGEAVVLRDEGQTGFSARQGDPIHVGDTVFTGADSTLRLKFKNMDIAIMGACANLQVDAYRDDRPNHQKIARLKSSRGNLLFYVLRLFGYQKIQFEVHTPSRVASVRGTKFGVSVNGTIGNHVNWLMTGAPLSTIGTTDCFCDSGSVTIDRSIVRAGIIYRGKSRTIDLLTVNDTEYFQSTFQHPVVPNIMNAITPPGHSQGRGQSGKVKGLKNKASDNPSAGRTKEKRARNTKKKTQNENKNKNK